MRRVAEEVEEAEGAEEVEGEVRVEVPLKVQVVFLGLEVASQAVAAATLIHQVISKYYLICFT